MRWSFIIAFLAYTNLAQTSIICDSDFCVCKLNSISDKDDANEIVDCSYYPTVLQQNYNLPSAVFSLDLSRNNLTYVNSSTLLHSSILSELYLNNNQIIEVNINALRLPKLRRLDLSNNQLESIKKGTFKYINRLEHLNLANNRFHSLSEIYLHHLSDLVSIVLDNNNIGPSLRNKSLFDRNGYGLTNKIQSLSISAINLNLVPDNFFVDPYDLRSLVISNNNLTAIFELPFTLQFLDLSDNPINEIFSEDFSEVTALKELKLNNLWIKEVPDYSFAFLRALTKLELMRNKNLTRFSELAFGQEVLEDADDFALESLSLRGSRLTTLSEKLNVPFGHLIHLDLQGNLWNCDCNLKWIKDFQINERESNHFRCYTPNPVFNSRVMELPKKYFVCAPNAKKHFVGVSISIVLVSLFLTAMAAFIFFYVPKHPRYNLIQNMPSAGYYALPVHMSIRDD